ncbi:hypothetical protein WR25_19341 isoform K [Diploscapter pachys]|nr:hypothetical protein WR25_19341 isoform D [Diploscapter pachys]PAV68176.1 hypothetical protein WR25_19341 isoform E [Diploscapter pachys]PAV68182.1 hypothetical protein WR25_19341 isoform K [Diploscapter pachys]
MKNALEDWYGANVVNDNEIDYSLLVIYIVLFLFTFILQYWQNQIVKANHLFLYNKVKGIVEEIERLSTNDLQYPQIYDAIVEDMPLQLAKRDGRVCQVPRLMLVTKDIVLLRPGQKAPCNCELVDGKELHQGEKLERQMQVCEETDAIEPLELVEARVTSSPINHNLENLFTEQENLLQFEAQINDAVHRINERILIPLFFVLSLLLTAYRFFNADDESLFHTRFVFAVPFLVALPLICPLYPVIIYLIKTTNNRQVFNAFGIVSQTTKDLVAILSALTTVAIIDKKGILSLPEPSIRKVMFFKSKGTKEPDDGDDDSTIPEILNLSSIQVSDDEWELDFDESSWALHLPSLLPMAYNMVLNSCAHNSDFARFLDHLSVVADSVPRTIATANRRCMCQLPIRIGFLQSPGGSPIPAALKNDGVTMGVYARQPGDPPVSGIVKHRTPLEMAFCTVQMDEHSLHSHLSSQGTAKLILDACTHFWSGEKVMPLTVKERRLSIDFHRRHSMTGHCLALAYRPVFGQIDQGLIGKYIELPLLGTLSSSETVHLVHSQSTDDLLQQNGINPAKVVTNSQDFINDVFTGQILCGLVALQYEAMPWATKLVELLDNACVRPVFFSKENELRSRVFAEKLGLEAGWNCHITLAEDEDKAGKRKIPAMEIFSCSTKSKISKLNGRFAKSDALLANLDLESFARNSPTRRQSLLTSDEDKVAPIPNKAQLPTGIDEVRPHLEAVDNVPLLVGLFTDCNTTSTLEMITIMQDYKEVVACIGSSLNSFNTQIHRKANLSISVDPLQCSSCKHEKAAINLSLKGSLSAISVASRLTQMSTDMHLNQMQCLKLPAIIGCARHRMASVRASLLFLLFASTLFSLTVVLSSLFFLPIIFTELQV